MAGSKQAAGRVWRYPLRACGGMEAVRAGRKGPHKHPGEKETGSQCTAGVKEEEGSG